MSFHCGTVEVEWANTRHMLDGIIKESTFTVHRLSMDTSGYQLMPMDVNGYQRILLILLCLSPNQWDNIFAAANLANTFLGQMLPRERLPQLDREKDSHRCSVVCELCMEVWWKIEVSRKVVEFHGKCSVCQVARCSERGSLQTKSLMTACCCALSAELWWLCEIRIPCTTEIWKHRVTEVVSPFRHGAFQVHHTRDLELLMMSPKTVEAWQLKLLSGARAARAM